MAMYTTVRSRKSSYEYWLMAMFIVSMVTIASTVMQLPRGNSTMRQPIMIYLQFVSTETPNNFLTDDEMTEEGSLVGKRRKMMPRGLSVMDLDIVCELLESLVSRK